MTSEPDTWGDFIYLAPLVDIMATDMTIGATIREQLGGSRFTVMVGVTSYVALNNGLQVRFPGRKINSMRVELEADDTYTVTFHKITNYGVNVKEVASYSGVYWSDLPWTFTQATGLDTHL
jgi:hypothetical protein